jgi:hypothetical protein
LNLNFIGYLLAKKHCNPIAGETFIIVCCETRVSRKTAAENRNYPAPTRQFSAKMPLSNTKDALNAAVQQVLSGERGRAVSSAMKIPYRTLMKRVTQRKLGIARVPRRRGPASLLPEEAESHCGSVNAYRASLNPSDMSNSTVKNTLKPLIPSMI